MLQAGDQERYDACGPGELFRPHYLPAWVLLEVDDFQESPIHAEMLDLLVDEEPYWCSCCHGVAKRRARGLHWFTPVQTDFK